MNRSGKRPTMLDQIIRGDLSNEMGLWNEHQCVFCGMALPAPEDSSQTTGIEAPERFIAVAKTQRSQT